MSFKFVCVYTFYTYINCIVDSIVDIFSVDGENVAGKSGTHQLPVHSTVATKPSFLSNVKNVLHGPSPHQGSHQAGTNLLFTAGIWAGNTPLFFGGKYWLRNGIDRLQLEAL